jgi:hypothetical protein
MRGKFFTWPGAGGNGNGACPDGLSTSNVAGCVPDHINLGGIEFVAMLFPRPRACEGPELIAIMVVVGEGAKFEEMPDAVMLEL